MRNIYESKCTFQKEYFGSKNYGGEICNFLVNERRSTAKPMHVPENRGGILGLAVRVGKKNGSRSCMKFINGFGRSLLAT